LRPVVYHHTDYLRPAGGIHRTQVTGGRVNHQVLDWVDVGRLEGALVNHEMRENYLDALKMKELSVERNEFWYGSL